MFAFLFILFFNCDQKTFESKDFNKLLLSSKAMMCSGTKDRLSNKSLSTPLLKPKDTDIHIKSCPPFHHMYSHVPIPYRCLC